MTALLNPNSLSELQQLLGDELYAITQLFAGQLTRDVQALQLLVEKDDYTTLATRAHAMKGSSGNLGATALAEWAAELEQSAKQHDGTRVQALNADLPALVEQTLETLANTGFLRR